MNKIFIYLLRLYQKTLSPDSGWLRVYYPYGYCRFYPHCSEYAAQALEKKSLFKAIYLIIKRLSKCHPWHPGGHDPI